MSGVLPARSGRRRPACASHHVDAFGQVAGGHNDEVIEPGLRHQSVTCPSTQVTEPPPIQMSAPERSTCTRPARPSAVPWLAM
jgi:hypothetical protein